MLSTHRRRSAGQKWAGFWLLVVGSLLLSVMSTMSSAAADEVAPPEPGPIVEPVLPGEPTLFPTIEPNSGLVDGQPVLVTLTGLPSRANMIAVQCVATASGQDACDLSYTRFERASTDGVYSVEFNVSRQIMIAGTLIDCAPDACIIGVGLLADDLYTPLETGGLAINFDASVPLPPPPTVKVAKNGKLIDGQTAKVTGKGWSTDAVEVQVEQCFSAAMQRGEGVAESCRYTGQGLITVDGRLNFKTTVYRSHYLDNRRIDCASQGVSCRLVVRSYQQRMQEASVDLTFSGDGPLAPRPKVKLSPRRNLVDGQTVNVRLRNVSSADEWSLMQCAKQDPEQYPGFGCRYLHSENRGNTSEVTVSRALSAGDQLVDCAAEKNRCFVQAMNYQTGASAKKGLIFAPTSDPVPEPSVVFSDNLQSLTDGATVTAEVSGPINDVNVSQCPANVDDVMSCSRLGYIYPDDEPVGEEDVVRDEEEAVPEAADQIVPAQASEVSPGTFVLEGTVRRVVNYQGESIDCAAAPGTCVLVAWDYQFGPIGNSPALTFIDEGPPSVPSVTMKSTDLGQRETVVASLTGMPVGRYIQVAQCLSNEDYRCRYLQGDLIRDADFTIEFVVQRTLQIDGSTIDCGSEAELCEMRFELEEQGAVALRVPLTFDPDAPPPPKPTVTVEPRTKLKHRQDVEVSVTNTFGYFGVAQCLIEASVQSQDCTYLGWDEWNMDEGAGSSVVNVQVRRVLTTESLGRVDCAEKRRRCKIAIVDGDGGGTMGEQRIQFDASVAAPPPPSISAKPSTDLVDGQEIEISAAGDSHYLSVLQCAGEISTDYPRRCRSVASLLANEAPPTFVAGVSRMLVGNDCARVSCSLVLVNNDNGQVEAHQPLTFDPKAKRQGQLRMRVAPTTGLADRQPVEVTLTGLVSWHNLMQCTVVKGEITNNCIGMSTEHEAIRRTVSTSVVNVRRNIAGHDCAAKARSCALVVRYSNGSDYYQEGEPRTKHKLLTFDAGAEPFPGPSITVDPAAGLAEGDIVRVVGSQFRTGYEVYVGICSSDFEIDRGELIGDCANDPAGLAVVDDDGSFDIEIAVSSTFRGFRGNSFSCLEDGCAVMATDGDEFILFDISFDPNAPAGEQLIINGLSWPKSLLDGSAIPRNGFSQLPRIDLQAS